MNGRRRILVLGAAAAAALLLAAFGAVRGVPRVRADEEPPAKAKQAEANEHDENRADVKQDDEKQDGDTEKKGADVRTIPLEEIYTTSKEARSVTNPTGRMTLVLLEDELRSRCTSIGLSNAFLVEGENVRWAIAGLEPALAGGSGAHKPIRVSAKRSACLWLVVMLGTSGSSPPEWTVTSVTQTDRRVRFTYRTGFSGTLDRHPYVYFVPLGDAKPGTYTLELVDEHHEEPRLVRRMHVPEQPAD